MCQSNKMEMIQEVPSESSVMFIPQGGELRVAGAVAEYCVKYPAVLVAIRTTDGTDLTDAISRGEAKVAVITKTILTNTRYEHAPYEVEDDDDAMAVGVLL